MDNHDGKAFGRSSHQQREEEEEEAKARRLLRFGSEVGRKVKAVKPEEVSTSIVPAAPRVVLQMDTRGVVNDNSQFGRIEAAAVGPAVDMDTSDITTPEPILGICPDMCPELERNERERKGDLDRFERLGDDRHQTTRDLAVKKYTRTAEKDAILIRPLFVLKETMRHLLSLLERDHEDDLLAVHSFLWDRMRAVRMDLRMQHIFTEEAIAMHEQMIRFHILAMHELCEFSVPSEGQGISEVFNAHLNIEQMNKASVDLFQMYDDHLKGGISVPSEAEFRGYYALLKLDKHPGYNVEPAELSLELAKMSPDIRNSRQVRFARNVARASRAGNFVAFFKLAREATYLQACLMHAHFSKLRTQALASLHSGLQKNQGIPLSTVVDWLGMEGEDIEALVKYHGFSIKYFEEAYMVKEGPLLNQYQDFPTSLTQLVQAKRSVRIVMDVQDEKQLELIPQSGSKLKSTLGMDTTERNGTPGLEKASIMASLEALNQKREEDLLDDVEEPIRGEVVRGEEERVTPIAFGKIPAEEGKESKKRRMNENWFEAEKRERDRLKHEADIAARQAAIAEMKRKELQVVRAQYDSEAFFGKQGTWFRRWRRRAAIKALERRRKQLEIEAALDALTLGFPIWKMRVLGASASLAQWTEYTEMLIEEQGLKLQKLWEPLDIPNLVVPILHGLNPAAQLLAWRLFLSTPSSPSGQWVRTKLGVQGKSETGQDFFGLCQSRISDAENSGISDVDGGMVDFQYFAEDLGGEDISLHSKVLLCGAGGLLFVMKEDEEVLKERTRLHSFVNSLPENANVPLLVVSTRSVLVERSKIDQTSEQEFWKRELRLGEVSTSEVSTYRVICIADGRNGCFSDEALREGLVWLAKLCPIQPQLRSHHVIDLVKEHLDVGLKNLSRMPLARVNPEDCINLFNHGIHEIAEKIACSAAVASTDSPLTNSVNEKKLTEGGGVVIHDMRGMSLNETWEAILNNLNSCVLPPFPPLKPVPKLSSINLQKQRLEEVLLQFLYLVEGNSSNNLTRNWEVNRLVGKGCCVEWSESGTKLVPKWAEIFKAIFSALLLFLKMMSWPPVYISQRSQSPLEVYKDKNETPVSQITTGLDFYNSGQLLLNDLTIAEEQQQSISSPVEIQTEVVSSPALQFEDAFPELNKQVSASQRLTGYTLLEDSPLGGHVDRDEESQAKRLRLTSTPFECSLDKMLAESKGMADSSGENAEVKKVNQLHGPSDFTPLKEDNNMFKHQLPMHRVQEGDGPRQAEDLGSNKENIPVFSQNSPLTFSPFEAYLDEKIAETSSIVIETSSKGYNGCNQHVVDMVTPNRRLYLGMEVYRSKHQELQSASWRG